MENKEIIESAKKDFEVYKEFCRVLNLKESCGSSLDFYNKYLEVLMLQKVGA